MTKNLFRFFFLHIVFVQRTAKYYMIHIIKETKVIIQIKKLEKINTLMFVAINNQEYIYM